MSMPHIYPGTDPAMADNVRRLVRRIKIGLSMPYLIDFFQTGPIDAATWDQTVVATGTITLVHGPGGYIHVVLAGAAPADEAILETDNRWMVRPGAFDDDTDVINQFVLEFMATIYQVQHLDNATTFLGLVPVQGNDRGSPTIIGFMLDGDLLHTLTDDGGVETVTDVSAGLTIADWNKYRIEVTNGHVVFYVNDEEVSDHETNLPDDEMYLCFHEQSDGAGGGLFIAMVRAWYEEHSGEL